MTVADSLDWNRDGAALHRGAALSSLAALERTLDGVAKSRAGVRLTGLADLATLLAVAGPVGSVAAARLGTAAQPVRALLFDKSAEVNWALGWHQDRTIAVQARHEVEGFGPWTMKAGLQHVEPPFAIIERMVTLRIHLDAVPEDNAPLLIAPGSHRMGRIAEASMEATVAPCGSIACLAERGDVWAYATPILHASMAAVSPRRRRVLQVDYSADTLPGGLLWAGI